MDCPPPGGGARRDAVVSVAIPTDPDDLVTVITPAHDAARFIEAAVRSVQAQTHPRWEMLVLVEAGISEATAAIVRRLARSDERIRLLEVPGARDVADKRNHGLAIARGRYVAFLDADDAWLPEKLERQVRFMRRTGAAISYTGYRAVTGGGRVGRVVRVPAEVRHEDLLEHNALACLTVMLDLRALGPVRMRRVDLEDFDLWARLLRSGAIARGLPDDLARYRVHGRSRSNRWFGLRPALSRWRHYREQERLSVAASAYYFAFYAVLTTAKRLRRSPRTAGPIR